MFDLGTAIGFPVGALHAVGNLLICSASQAHGVAVFDISDPAEIAEPGFIAIPNTPS